MCPKATSIIALALSLCKVESIPLSINANGTLPPCDVQSCGESDHNVSRLEMLRVEQESKYESGLFLLRDPIDYNGTVVGVSASGYCILVNRTGGQRFEMRLGLYEAQNRRRIDTVTLPADCTDESSEDSVICNVQSNVKLSVKAGQFIGILFNAQCSPEDMANRCSCRPATVDRDNIDEQFLYLNSSNNNFRNFPINTDGSESVGLQFSFTFQAAGKCDTPSTPDSSSNETLLVAVAVALSALTVLLLLVISSVILHKFYRWRKHKASVTNVFQSNPQGVQDLNNNVYSVESTESGGQQDSTAIQTKQKERKDSVTYDYAREEQSDFNLPQLPELSDGHYETDGMSSDEPFWEPASVEDDLKSQLQDLSLSHDTLSLSSELGSGEFGVVRRGVWSVGVEEREVAVKSLADGSTEEKRIQFLQEAAIMGQFKHPNVISLHGVLLHRDPMMIVLEMMHIGDLREYLHSLKPSDTSESLPAHTPALLMSFCRHIASGMAYLSGKGFVHRDLAARNILVSKDEVCKIGDFGMSRALKDTDYYVSRGGKIPVKWSAPEALHYKKYSTASDVWSFGVVLYEIWTMGIKPYRTISNKEVYDKIQSGYRLPPPPGCPRAVYQTMINCWSTEPESRPTFPEVQVELQRPDFKLLTWTAEDVAAYTEEARTLGGPLEAAEELYTDIQKTYI